jgi:ATP-dependent protease Clp ATPase subunit
MDIIKEESKSNFSKNEEGVPSPKEIYATLDEYVIGQKKSKTNFIRCGSQSLQKIKLRRKK